MLSQDTVGRGALAYQRGVTWRQHSCATCLQGARYLEIWMDWMDGIAIDAS